MPSPPNKLDDSQCNRNRYTGYQQVDYLTRNKAEGSGKEIPKMPAKAQHSLKSIYQRGYDTGDTGKQRLHHTTHKATNDIYQAFDTRQQPIKETGLTGVIRSPTTATTTASAA